MIVLVGLAIPSHSEDVSLYLRVECALNFIIQGKLIFCMAQASSEGWMEHIGQDEGSAVKQRAESLESLEAGWL